MSDYTEGLNSTEILALEAIANKGKKTYTDIAEELGLSRRHLTRIRQKPKFKEALRIRAMEEMSESVNEFTRVVEKRALEGHYKFAELYAKMNGLLVEKSEVKQTSEEGNRPYKGLSNEDLEKEMRKLQDELKDFDNNDNDVIQ